MAVINRYPNGFVEVERSDGTRVLLRAADGIDDLALLQLAHNQYRPLPTAGVGYPKNPLQWNAVNG